VDRKSPGPWVIIISRPVHHELGNLGIQPNFICFSQFF
jgi:hypothetical protein